MAKLERSAEEAFRADARKMFFSNDSIDAFISVATPTQLVGVCELLDCELRKREEAKKQKLIRKARFPVVKSLADFDFTDVAFPEGYGKEDLSSLKFIECAQDFVFYGKTGRGKTHMAIALGFQAIERGMEVRFFETAELVRQLSRALEEGGLDRLLKDIDKADLIVLDEFGYIPLDIDGARLLFQVISRCYERRSLILTTNIEFSKWGMVFADDKLAAAAIDRIVHHGRLVEFKGSSRRVEHALMLAK